MIRRLMRGISQRAWITANHNLLRRTPVIVYSMERTGTVAVHQSLLAHKVFALATHSLDAAKIPEGRVSGSARWACRHLIEPRREVKLITLVRNPLDNLLSTFARQVYESDPRAAASPEEHDSIARRFVEEYLGSGRHLGPLYWFENEYRVAVGIDVFEYLFNKNDGFTTLREGSFQALILRTELADDAKAAAIAAFLGLQSFSLTPPDRVVRRTGREPGVPGASSPYAQLYSFLRATVAIPPAQLEQITSTPLWRHFIRDDERRIAPTPEATHRTGTPTGS